MKLDLCILCGKYMSAMYVTSSFNGQHAATTVHACGKDHSNHQHTVQTSTVKPILKYTV